MARAMIDFRLFLTILISHTSGLQLCMMFYKLTDMMSDIRRSHRALQCPLS
jgi:hypothetical protein